MFPNYLTNVKFIYIPICDTLLLYEGLNMNYRPCPICDSSINEPHIFSDLNWHVRKCSKCSMIFLANPPDQSSLSEEFAWEQTRDAERYKRRKNRKLYYFFSDGLKKLKRFSRRGKRKEIVLINKLKSGQGSLLDIGCAEGTTLSHLDPKKWTLYGIEPSPSLAARANEICSASGGYAVQATAVDGMNRLNANSFDVINMRSFLEHDVYAEKTLIASFRALKDDGLVLIKVPNANCWNAKLRGFGWPGVRHPDHVNYFTPSTLKEMVLKAGYTKIYFPTKWRLPSSDNMWLAAYK